MDRLFSMYRVGAEIVPSVTSYWEDIGGIILVKIESGASNSALIKAGFSNISKGNYNAIQ